MNDEKKPFETVEHALYRVNGTLMNGNTELAKLKDEVKTLSELLRELLKPE